MRRILAIIALLVGSLAANAGVIIDKWSVAGHYNYVNTPLANGKGFTTTVQYVPTKYYIRIYNHGFTTIEINEYTYRKSRIH